MVLLMPLKLFHIKLQKLPRPADRIHFGIKLVGRPAEHEHGVFVFRPLRFYSSLLPLRPIFRVAIHLARHMR